MSQHFFTVPRNTQLAIGKGDDGWIAIEGATSIGVDDTGPSLRLLILEGDTSRHHVLESRPRNVPHPFRLTFPNGSVRLFAASIISSEQEGKAILTTIEMASPVTRMHPGVVDNLPDPVRTGAGGNARDLPELGV